jgi:hypothetical protein
MTGPGNAMDPPRADNQTRVREVVGMLVAVAGLVALVLVVLVAILKLPANNSKGQNIVAISTSAFGVIGAVVGTFFGVRTANKAVEKLRPQSDEQ